MSRGFKIVAGVAVMAASSFIGWKIWKKYKEDMEIPEEIIRVEDLKRLKEEAGVAQKFGSVKDLLLDDPFTSVLYNECDEKLEDEEHDEKLEDEEGDGKMRKGTDPNSSQALEQFINMNTADLQKGFGDDQMLRILFGIPFKPETTGDKVLYGALLASRLDFFGPESKWSNIVTWADVLIHYADKLDFEIGGGQSAWIHHFFEHLEFVPQMNREEMRFQLTNLTKHNFINHNTGLFGLFGLDDSGCLDLHCQLEYSVEKRYSFEMEFNSFIEMKLSEEEETADIDDDL